MGLDMYLVVTANDTDELIAATKSAGLLQHWYDGSVKAIGDGDKQLVVAYWRKANAIHGWFVRTQANGVDECQLIPVARDALMDLVARCKQVLLKGATEKAALEWDLPTQNGFYFGGTGYDEWYRNDLEETVKQIEAVLNVEWPMEVSFAYEASW